MIRVVSNCLCEACDCSVVELGEVGGGMVNNLGCGMCYFCQFVSVGDGQHVVKTW